MAIEWLQELWISCKSLLILGYLRYLPCLCGKKVLSCTTEVTNESSWELKLLLC